MGVWFEFDELTKVAKKFEQNSTGDDDLAILKVPMSDINPWHPGRELVRLCPEDNSQMEEYVYAGDSAICVSHCVKCSGTWLDGGELAKLKAYLKPDPISEMMGKAMIEDDQKNEDLKEAVANAPRNLHMGMGILLSSGRFL
jgi:Zn-finger nucleic acid-binding protein